MTTSGIRYGNLAIMTLLTAALSLISCGKPESQEPVLAFGTIKKLTNEGADQPEWSPDGARIAFVLDNTLYAISPEGGASSTIASIPGGTLFSPRWDPTDSDQLVFLNYDGATQNWEIYTVKIGREPVRIYSTGSRLLAPSFTRDGSRIAFSLNPGSRGGIWTISANGGEPSPWPREGSWGVMIDAECARDADLISFVEQVGAAAQLYTLPGDGGLPVKVTNLGSDISLTMARRSPDGSRYALRLGEVFYWIIYNIWLIQADGGSLTQLTTYNLDEYMIDLAPDFPSWSPDGRKLVIARREKVNNAPELWIIDLL